jgi:hypothetical protein
MQIHCLRKRHILVCEKKHSESAKKLSEADIIKMLDLLIDNIFVMFGERIFQKDSRQTCGYNLCSSSVQPIPLFVRGRLDTGASQQNEEKLA